MIKTLGLFRRRSDLTLDGFSDYYETRHAPLGASLLDFAGYTRNYPASDADARVLGVDGLSEFWFEDAGSLTRLGERLAGDAGPRLAEDEERFMDRATNHSYEVAEHAFGQRPPPGEQLRAVAVVRLPAGVRPGARERRLAFDPTREKERRIPGFLASLHSVPLRAMKPPPSGTPWIACVESLWLRDVDALAQCNRLRSAAGATPLSVVREFGATPKSIGHTERP